MIGTGRLLSLICCGVLKVGILKKRFVCRLLECVRGADYKRIPGELWVMCQNIKRNKFCASVNVGSELLYSRKVATTTEDGSDESGFPVFKGSRKRGGWLSACSARGADLHRLLQKMREQVGLLINKTKKGHR